MKRLSVSAIVLFAILLAMPVLAADRAITNGIDLWRTPGDGTTFADFSKQSIPAGFFCNKSEAFTGKIVFHGVPVATGQPGTLQIRLADAATKGERAGLGACTGDSGAPVYRPIGGALAVIGVVSWSTGPALSDGCGGLTGVTPLVRYRDWIVQTAAKLGSPLR